MKSITITRQTFKADKIRTQLCSSPAFYNTHYYNDIVSDSDRHYSHCVRRSHGLPALAEPCLLFYIARIKTLIHLRTPVTLLMCVCEIYSRRLHTEFTRVKKLIAC